LITASDLAGVGIISAIFAVILLTAELWSRRWNGKPEWTRKLVHLGGGVVGLFLPFLIESPWVVLLLTVSLSAIFFIGGKTGLLKSIHGVKRVSRGGEYYPLAIFLVFLIAADRPWLYLSAVLVLAVADAFAALIGSRYGRLRYEVEDEHKSVEGSLVFLVIAFLAVHLPTLLMTDLPRGVVVLSALLVAMLVTGFEAISLGGTDNVFVPIAVCFVLQKITTKPVEEIAYQVVSFVAIFLVVFLIGWKFRSFNAGGAMAVVLFAYATWSLGSRRWTLPVFVALLAFVLVRALYRKSPPEPLKVRVLTHALLVPFVVLMAANLTGRYGFFFAPYVLATAMVLALVWWHGRETAGALVTLPRPVAAGLIGALAAVVVALPVWLTTSSSPSILTMAVMAGIGALLTILGALVSRLRIETARPAGWSGVSFLLCLGAAGTMMILQRMEIVEPFAR
jgi:phytol kinase